MQNDSQKFRAREGMPQDHNPPVEESSRIIFTEHRLELYVRNWKNPGKSARNLQAYPEISRLDF
jgi:hypothetical protein